MKDANQNPSEEAKSKSIEVAKERFAELDEDQLEKLSGGAHEDEQTTMSGCSCQTLCGTM